MTLEQFVDQLRQLLEEARAAFAQAASPEAFEAARVEFLGAKQGRLKVAQKGLGELSPADKPAGGKQFNEIKTELEALLTASRNALDSRAATTSSEPFDPTEAPPAARVRIGRLHPITLTIENVKEIMGRLGFELADGPEVEDEWHNFEALNIPASHPARDPLENFFLATAQAAQPGAAKPMLLRSQTSTVQIRVMERTPPPVRIISLGRVYRPDTADATHFPMFHQMEGLYVDTQVTMADLKSVLRMFASAYLGGEVSIRFRPSFFPFTEPSVEVDMSWGDRWIEMGGAGMVDPAVLSAAGYNPEQVTGFAFGLGVERLCMRRYNIQDIRDLYKNDVRFLRQFAF